MTLIKLLSFLAAVSALKYVIDEELTGMPEVLHYETMYGKSESTEGGAVEYELTVSGNIEFPVYLIIGEKKYFETSIFCYGKKLIHPVNPSPQLFVYEFRPDKNLYTKGNIPITRDGLYSFITVSCAIQNNEGDEGKGLSLKGSLSFINSGGYLPIHKQPYPAMYFCLVLLYLATLIAWGYWCNQYKQNLIICHHCIFALLTTSLLELFFEFVYFQYANSTGNDAERIFTIVKVLFICRKALSRVVLFLIFNGVFITRRNISKKKTFVLCAYSAIFLVLSVLIAVNKGYMITQEYSNALIALLIAANFLDWAFFIWAYFCLYKTLESIKENDTFKRGLFLSMAQAGGVGCVVAIIFILFQIRYISQKTFMTPEGWRSYFVYDILFWEILAYYLLVVAMAILKPSIDRSNYVQLKTDDDIEKHFSVWSSKTQIGDLEKKMFETSENGADSEKGAQKGEREKGSENEKNGSERGLSGSESSDAESDGEDGGGRKKGNCDSDDNEGVLDEVSIKEWVEEKNSGKAALDEKD